MLQCLFIHLVLVHLLEDEEVGLLAARHGRSPVGVGLRDIADAPPDRVWTDRIRCCGQRP